MFYCGILAGTRRNNNAIDTSKRRRGVVLYVIITQLRRVHGDIAGKLYIYP